MFGKKKTCAVCGEPLKDRQKVVLTFERFERGVQDRRIIEVCTDCFDVAAWRGIGGYYADTTKML